MSGIGLLIAVIYLLRYKDSSPLPSESSVIRVKVFRLAAFAKIYSSGLRQVGRGVLSLPTSNRIGSNMKKILGWIMVVCSLLLLVPAGVLVYMNGIANGLGFFFVMAMPPLLVGVLLFRQPFPRNAAVAGVLLSIFIGALLTWYSKTQETKKLRLPEDPSLKKELQTFRNDSSDTSR